MAKTNPRPDTSSGSNLLSMNKSALPLHTGSTSGTALAIAPGSRRQAPEPWPRFWIVLILGPADKARTFISQPFANWLSQSVTFTIPSSDFPCGYRQSTAVDNSRSTPPRSCDGIYAIFMVAPCVRFTSWGALRTSPHRARPLENHQTSAYRRQRAGSHQQPVCR